MRKRFGAGGRYRIQYSLPTITFALYQLILRCATESDVCYFQAVKFLDNMISTARLRCPLFFIKKIENEYKRDGDVCRFIINLARCSYFIFIMLNFYHLMRSVVFSRKTVTQN